MIAWDESHRVIAGERHSGFTPDGIQLLIAIVALCFGIGCFALLALSVRP